MRPTTDPQMRPYTATGRRGKVNVRHFRTEMTHAVDVDGLVWKFFSSASAAHAYAAERNAQGRDAVVVPAQPYVTAQPVATVVDRGYPGSAVEFAANIRSLMDTAEPSRRMTPDELIEALSDEGVMVAAEVVRRIMTGAGRRTGRLHDRSPCACLRCRTRDHLRPARRSKQRIRGLGIAPTAWDRETEEASVGRNPDEGVVETRAGRLALPVNAIGQLIVGLANAADRCLDQLNPEVVLAARLMRGLGAISRELDQSASADVSIPREVLEDIVIAVGSQWSIEFRRQT